MKWEMEIEETEAILEKIWDLHDKLSDAIHSISRTHFLNSIKTLKNSDKNKTSRDVGDDDNRAGFVFVKDCRLDYDDSAVQEAKSLDAIRTALENLEDQLEFFHTIQTQQRVERDAAIAQLEQSRIVLSRRLAEHHGKKYKVIEEALAFVGDVHNTGRFVSPENLYGQPCNPSGGNFMTDNGKRSNILVNVLLSSFNFVKKSLGLDSMGGVVGNVAMVAVSVIALLHFHQLNHQERQHGQENGVCRNRTVRKTAQLEGSSSNSRSNNLDVFYARG
ncbi:hypothetical protein L6164_016301 [Bauhinia variegata]|uniref:Uncharacterized protein n=1 Tax=Bauhinia variegata TaxID=167791 RepID=A0ACB9NQK7_BAUVA|nr:hypothetical protein L6164_016301 [Bauhinia variegata]